jgi:hypothetical protein
MPPPPPDFLFYFLSAVLPPSTAFHPSFFVASLVRCNALVFTFFYPDSLLIQPYNASSTRLLIFFSFYSTTSFYYFPYLFFLPPFLSSTCVLIMLLFAINIRAAHLCFPAPTYLFFISANAAMYLPLLSISFS